MALTQNMERRLRNRVIRPLPGDRQGTSGASAGRDSMRTASGATLTRRARTNRVSPEQVTADFQQTSPSTSGSSLDEISPPARTRHPRPREAVKRMKWTPDMNKAVIRAYYLATNIETDRTGYLSKIKSFWLEQFPSIDVTTQRLADQVRVVLTRHFLSSVELQRIREEVTTRIRLESPNQEAAYFPQEPTPETCEQDELSCANSEGEIENGDLSPEDMVEETLVAQHTLFEGIPLENRRPLPRVFYNRKTLKVVKAVDKLLRKYVSRTQGLQEVRHWAYVAAKTVTITLGMEARREPEGAVSEVKKREPRWRRRLELKVQNLRRKIGIITNYIRDPEVASNKLRRKIDEIVVQDIGLVMEDDLTETLRLRADKLKQKLAVYANRIRRYTKAELRKNKTKHFERMKNLFIEH